MGGLHFTRALLLRSFGLLSLSFRHRLLFVGQHGENAPSRLRTRDDARLLAGLAQPFGEAAQSQCDRCGIAALGKQDELGLLDVVGNEYTKIAGDRNGVWCAQHAQGLRLGDTAMTGNQMHDTRKFGLIECGCIQVVAQKWLAHQFARRGNGQRSGNGVEAGE
jgi:hypothetical protein